MKEMKSKIFFSSHDMFQRVIKQNYDLKRQRMFLLSVDVMIFNCHLSRSDKFELNIENLHCNTIYWTFQFSNFDMVCEYCLPLTHILFCNLIGSWSQFCQSFHQHQTSRMYLLDAKLLLRWTDVRNGRMTFYFTKLSSSHSFEIIFQSIKIDK